MRTPLGVVIGTGRMAGGFVAPLLDDAGWRTLLVGRDSEVVNAIGQRGAVWVRTGRSPSPRRRVEGVSALGLTDAGLPAAIAGADLLATAVGPGALGEVGTLLGPLLRERLERWGRPLNVVTFENHRRAPELLTAGLLDAEPSLASEIGKRLGVGGAAVWRAIARRTIDRDEVTYDADEVDECYVDLVPLLKDLPPRDGSVGGLRLVRRFDDRMTEKQWVFNAGHAAAAYLGWLAGCSTLAEALVHDPIHRSVATVVDEGRQALQARMERRPAAEPFLPRSLSGILARYADPALKDSVTRVGREPRRKLGANDRLVAPAVACLACGVWPVGLATAIAAALSYREPSDPQAADLDAEVRLLGAEEVLQTISGLHPRDELSRLVCLRLRSMQRERLASAA